MARKAPGHPVPPGSPDVESAGARIRTLRRERGLTQKDLAEATGVSRSAVAQWETGRAGHSAKDPEIAAALKVPVPALSGTAVRDAATTTRTETDEAELLRRFRLLDWQDRAMVTRILSRLAPPRSDT